MPTVLTRSEVRRVIARMEGTPRFFATLLYGTGMRISELCGLSLGDLDPEAAVVRVFGKGAKERIVPLGRPGVTAQR